MKIMIALAAVLVVGGSAFAQTTAPATKPVAKPAATKSAAKPADKKVASKMEKIVDVCPINGEKVADLKTADKSVYNGVTYYFCCAGCKPKFDKDPAKFAKASASNVKEVPANPTPKKS
jgi:YHS domain-containing protein